MYKVCRGCINVGRDNFYFKLQNAGPTHIFQTVITMSEAENISSRNNDCFHSVSAFGSYENP